MTTTSKRRLRANTGGTPKRQAGADPVLITYSLPDWDARIYRMEASDGVRILVGGEMNAFLTRSYTPIALCLALLYLGRGESLRVGFQDSPITITRDK